MKRNFLILLIITAFLTCITQLEGKSKSKKSRKPAPALIIPTHSEKIVPEDDLPIESGLETEPESSTKKIRVLLAEHNSTHETKFLIKSANGFILESPVGIGQTAIYNKPELHLLCSGDKLFLQCRDGKYRRIKYTSIEACNATSNMVLNGTSYQGSLTFRLDEEVGKVLVINKLPLEDYVSSVVYSESIPTWPYPMQKIQAIASRTYALFLMQQARIKNPLFKYFDIKNTNLHQVYKGAHGYSHIKRAVEETKNIIVTHKGKIALTMFDICCAGAIPALMVPKDFSKPYLMRSESCQYCHQNSSFQWKSDIHDGTFLRELKDNSPVTHKFKKFGSKLESVTMQQIDKAGQVHKVKIHDQHGNCVTLTGSELRKSFPSKIKSLSFTIKKVRDRIVINGKGYGHQRGLCQWGAKELVDRSWSTKKILKFYYPGTTLSRLA